MFANVTSATKIVGIFGHPIKHSLSPRMHNAAFRELELDMIYLPIDVTAGALKKAMVAIKVLNLVGVNLTRPHKIAALDHLDDVSDEAQRIGAVNTVVNAHGTLVGHNTDGAGFLQSLKKDCGFDPQGKNIVVFGAGGAGRAICWALSQAAPDGLTVVNRTFRKAETLAKLVGGCAFTWDDPKLHQEIAEAHLLVNATSVALPWNTDAIREGVLVYDIAYSHQTSAFTQGLKEKGARTGDGLSMLLYQGALAFELWTGKKAPLDVMRKAIRDPSGQKRMKGMNRSVSGTDREGEHSC